MLVFSLCSIFFSNNGCVVQLDRISDFGSEGWGFEPLRGHKKIPATIRHFLGLLAGIFIIKLHLFNHLV